MVTALLGSDSSVGGLATVIVERASGNPFLSSKRWCAIWPSGAVLTGSRGDYVCRDDHVDAAVPATLQATIAARIDRLVLAAKHSSECRRGNRFTLYRRTIGVARL